MNASFENSRVTLTGIVHHDRDLLFAKHKEELAQRLRKQFRNSVHEVLGRVSRDFEIDDDGDVRAAGRLASIYAGRDTTFFVVHSTVGKLKTQDFAQLANLTSDFVSARDDLQTTSFSLQLFFLFFFIGETAAAALSQTQLVDMGKISSLGDFRPGIRELKVKAESQETGFRRAIEFEANARNIEFTYRLKEEGKYKSLPEFIDGVGIGGILENSIRPVVQGFVDHPDINPVSFGG